MGRARGKRGSLTIEATIVFPFFLVFFFIFLFLIKTACIDISLEHAVKGTTREIAASYYSLSVLEEMGAEKTGESELFSAAYEGLQSFGKYRWVQSLLEDYLEGSLVDPEKIRYCQIEIPSGKVDYDGENDVVIRVEYDIHIPFLTSQETVITLRHTAVERAWVYGGNRVYAGLDDVSIWDKADELSDDSRIVYITEWGEKYHRHDCRYLHSSSIPIDIEKAKKRGYEPCKVCKPPP